MFGALKRGCFRSLASLILVVNVVGELQQKRTLAASRGFLAAARLSCSVSCSESLLFDFFYYCRFTDKARFLDISCESVDSFNSLYSTCVVLCISKR